MAFPILTGIVLDRFVSGYAIIFGFCSVAYLIAFGVNQVLAPRFEPVEMEKTTGLYAVSRRQRAQL